MAQVLPDGRLWLRHGPIEIFVLAEGALDQVRAAYGQAMVRFATVLGEVAADLTVLRAPAADRPALRGIPARMRDVAAGFQGVFVTPMAAVAGAVAESVLAAMLAGRDLVRVIVNNGGDIALHLSGDAVARLALVSDPVTGASPGRLIVAAGSGVRGIATSGVGGRSHSLGIADAVTVLAATAAAADVAATLIANAVDLPGHPHVVRRPARELAPDSDLGARLVTVQVGALTLAEVDRALDAGAACAQAMIATGQIIGAAIVLRNIMRLEGAVPFAAHQEGATWQRS
ncbi:MAG: UPF0280 family protein [Gemmobacter sp.]|nr:UPF0280 family protein [Gemmobacter sp.]